ncbi:GIY-YIG nuclease family protein [Deinococcus sp. QL22]|uniref:GIY-YIG nuclease family protein n=1 Tax=Deinococcus sp. QL22 TaxID=2939437 RepID=UPI002018002F|nr:GIY-YIG nuclease family protein [Deinococcus sp. QL22]UQN10147.1 GIY-YIG nuclease family protein [Deinococcus sp. QL22]
MSQFVYVLEDQNTHLIKIGISVDPEFRAKQVGKDFGTATVVAGILNVDDAFKTERFFHAMFADRRVVGEWFELTEQQKTYLLAYFSDKLKRPVAQPRSMKSIVTIEAPPKENLPPNLNLKTTDARHAVEVALATQQKTQLEVAQALGTHASTLSRLLNENRPLGTRSLWPRLLDLLGLEIVIRPKQK